MGVKIALSKFYHYEAEKNLTYLLCYPVFYPVAR